MKLHPQIQRIINAFGYSFAGLKATFKTETAFKQELLLAVFAIPTALLLQITVTQKALLIASVLLILITELINTAIEAIVDYISLEKHALAKKAKDAGSAIVLLAFINAIFIWLIILII